MPNPFEPPRSDCTLPPAPTRICPDCGAGITTAQYVFNPKPNRVRCRGCRTELTFRAPLPDRLRIVLASLAVAPLALLPLLLGMHPGWLAASMAVGLPALSFYEARYILDHFPAVKIER